MDSFAKHITAVKDAVMVWISEVESHTLSPVAIQSQQMIVQREFEKCLGAIRAAAQEYQSQLGADYLASTTNIDFLQQQLLESFEAFGNRSIEGMRAGAKILSRLDELHTSCQNFLGRMEENAQKDEIRAFTNQINEEYTSLVINLLNEGDELRRKLNQIELEKASTPLSSAMKRSLDEERISEIQDQARSKMQSAIKVFFDRCEEVKQEVLNLLNQRRDN